MKIPLIYRKKLFSLLSILISLFVYIGAVGLYMYANGWRFGTPSQILIRTGVLTVESEPFLADIYIEGKQDGRTPKNINLPVGRYDISVTRSGYVTWEKDVEVKEQKSTPVFPWLVKGEITAENIFQLSGKTYINSWITEGNEYIYFLTKEYIPDIQMYRYEMYRFGINTQFWDLSSNPKVVLTLESSQDQQIEINWSPSGILGLLKITNTSGVFHYLIDSNSSATIESLTLLDLTPFLSHTISWSNNNRYLLFESTTELISFDIQKQTRYLLIQKTEGMEYVWSTDTHGNFYKVEDNLENTNESVYAYSLVQSLMDGSGSEIFINDLYFQKDITYISTYTNEQDLNRYLPFTNSTQSTKSVGKLQSINVNQHANGIYIKTETSSYWYSIENGKYYLISPYPSELVQYSPNNWKLIYKDTQGYGVFTFKKEDGDHTVDIGSKQVKGLTVDSSNVNWIYNSSYIWFNKNNTIYTCDIDGDNHTQILSNIDTLEHFVITFTSENALTFYLADLLNIGVKDIYIDSYLIH